MKFENLKTCGNLWGNNSNSTHVDWWTAKHHFSRPRNKQDRNRRGPGMRIVVCTRNLLPVSRPRGQPSRYLKLSIQLKKDHKLVWVGKYLICVKCPPYEVQSAFLSHSGYKPHPGGGGYSHTLPIRVCATGSWFWSSWFRTGYPFQRHFLERGIKNCGSRLYLLLKIVADYEEAFIWYIGRTNKE